MRPSPNHRPSPSVIKSQMRPRRQLSFPDHCSRPPFRPGQTRAAAKLPSRPQRGGSGCRRQHPSKSRGKAKGRRKARGLDVSLNHRLASWRVAAAAGAGEQTVWALEAGVPASAAVEYYLSGCLGWEDETDGEEYEDYGEEPAEPTMDSDLEIDPVDMRMWGVLGVGGNSVDVMEGEQQEEDAEEEWEQQEEDEEEEEEEEEPAIVDHYEKRIKWKKRHQERKKMRRKQQQKRQKDPHPAPAYLYYDKTAAAEEEEEEMEQEEHPAVSYHHHMKKTKREKEHTLDRDDDKDDGEEEKEGMEPGEMEEEEVEEGERVTKEKEGEELGGGGGGEVEQQGADDDFGFCKVGWFVWGDVAEEDLCVVEELEM